MPAICHRQIFPLVFQRVRTIDRKLMYFRFYIASGSLGFPFTEPFFLSLPFLSSLFLFLFFFFAILRFEETLSSRLPVRLSRGSLFLRDKSKHRIGSFIFTRERSMYIDLFSCFSCLKKLWFLTRNIEQIIACDLTISIKYTKILQMLMNKCPNGTHRCNASFMNFLKLSLPLSVFRMLWRRFRKIAD